MAISSSEMCVYVPDMGMQTEFHSSPIVLYHYPDGAGPVEGKPRKATVKAAAGYRYYQWYVNGEERGNSMTLELQAADYSPGTHRLALIFRKHGRGIPAARHLTFKVVGISLPREQ